LKVSATRKSLLVRADFVLGRRQAGDVRVYKRWRRILLDALPRLLGCERRCRRAERVRLRAGAEEGRFSAWLRIAIERRPSRKRARKLAERLRGRLEASLRPIDGHVVKIGVRRCRAGVARLPAAADVQVPAVPNPDGAIPLPAVAEVRPRVDPTPDVPIQLACA
jgi:hypothetical protein